MLPNIFPLKNCTGNITNDIGAMDLCSVTELLKNAMAILLYVAAAIAALFILIGAFHYFTAYGNEDKATQGKKTIMWAIVGVVVIFSSYMIVNEVWNLVSNQPVNTGTPPTISGPPTSGTTPALTPTPTGTTPTPTPTPIVSSGNKCTTEATNLYIQMKIKAQASAWETYIKNGPSLGPINVGGEVWSVDIETGDPLVDGQSSNQCSNQSRWIALDKFGQYNGNSYPEVTLSCKVN